MGVSKKRQGGRKKVNNTLPGYRVIVMWLIMVFLIIIPFVSHLIVIELKGDDISLYQSYKGYAADIFLVMKSRVVIAFAVFLILEYIGEKIFPDYIIKDTFFRDRRNFVLLGAISVYSLGVIFSTLLSQHKRSAMWGSLSEGEGMFVLLAYLVIFLSIFRYFPNQKGIEIFEKGMLILSYITILLICVEVFYKPLVEVGIFKSLIASSEYREYLDSVDTSEFSGRITLTFFNPNYCGGFLCLLYPFSLGYLYVNEDRLRHIMWLVSATGIMFGIVASGNTATIYIMLFVTCVMLIALAFRRYKRRLLVYAQFAVCGFVVFLISLLLSKGKSAERIADLFVNAGAYSLAEDTYAIKDIVMDGNILKLVGNDSEINVVYEKHELHLEDKSGKGIKTNSIKDEIELIDDVYHGLTMRMNAVNKKGILCKIMIDAGYQDTIDFFIVDGEFRGIASSGEPLKSVKKDDYSGMKFYGLFTGRGYAWINTIPMLKNNILVGRGPGCFNYYFDHSDYLGMLATHGNVKRIIDKPHNAFLQMAVNIGIIGCIAYVAIMVICLVRMIKTYKSSVGICEDGCDVVILSAAASIAGYLLYMCVNDSMVVVSPIMWGCMGFGMAICVYLGRDRV